MSSGNIMPDDFKVFAINNFISAEAKIGS